MTRYRYNAILHVGQRTEAANEVVFEDWTDGELTLDQIRSRLLRHPDQPSGFKCIRNARIQKDLAALAILRGSDLTRTALDLRRGNRADRQSEEFILKIFLIWKPMTRASRVFLSWAACRLDGSYDALFVPRKSLYGHPPSAIA